MTQQRHISHTTLSRHLLTPSGCSAVLLGPRRACLALALTGHRGADRWPFSMAVNRPLVGGLTSLTPAVPSSTTFSHSLGQLISLFPELPGAGGCGSQGRSPADVLAHIVTLRDDGSPSVSRPTLTSSLSTLGCCAINLDKLRRVKSKRAERSVDGLNMSRSVIEHS